MYILIHIQLCGWVSDRNIFTKPIFRNKTTLVMYLRLKSQVLLFPLIYDANI